MTYVLDACVIVALFKKEKGFEKVKALLDEARASQATNIYMHSINLIEAYYYFYRTWGKDKSTELLEQIYKLPITLIDTIDEVIFSEASRLKANYPIPLGDAIGLATAIKLGGSFVSGDHSDFEKIKKAEPVSIYWFR